MLEAAGERLVGKAHTRKYRISAAGWNFAGEQDRAKRRDLIIAVVSVPATPDIGRLVCLLANFRDLRVARHSLEESVDVDSPKPLGNSDVLLGSKLLISEEDHAVLIECSPDCRDLIGVHRLRQIDADDLGAQCS